MKTIDQLGNELFFDRPPQRIISIVPSQTELIYDLGIIPIAQTIFCIHPDAEFKTSVKIGGTKKLNLDKIRSLKPDLIIGNKEENVQEQIHELQKDFPVWMSDVNTLHQATEMIESVGVLLAKNQQALAMSKEISHQFKRLITSNNQLKSCIYLIWKDPMMSVANHTFINDMLKYAGFENALSHLSRYPELSIQDVQEIAPEYILLSSEPYPFTEIHQREFEKLFPKSKVMLVDGEMFSWYGSRLLKSVAYFENIQKMLNAQNQELTDY